MRGVSLWGAVSGVEKTVFESVEYDQVRDLLVAKVRPMKRARGRCGVCHRPCSGFDCGDGRRRWRALDLGTAKGGVGGRRTQGVVAPAWGGGCCGAVGLLWRRVYVRVR